MLSVTESVQTRHTNLYSVSSHYKNARSNSKRVFSAQKDQTMSLDDASLNRHRDLKSPPFEGTQVSIPELKEEEHEDSPAHGKASKDQLILQITQVSLPSN